MKSSLPDGPLPILPLRTGVLFPGTTLALPVGRERSVRLFASVSPGAVVGLVAQRDPKIDDPKLADLYAVGTFARVTNVSRMANGTFRVALQGLGRFVVDELVETEPFLRAIVRAPSETHADAI